MKFTAIAVFSAWILLLIGATFIQSYDFDQDLGRHLAIGKIIVETGKIPDTNTFSYTNSSFPFLNHHWLSEVIFYGAQSLFGLTSLIVLKALFSISAAAIITYVVYRIAGLLPTILSLLLVTPLLVERSHIRPEIFGYLIFSVLLSILISYPVSRKYFFLVPPLLLLWVNLHIAFIFGVFVGGLILLKVFYNSKLSRHEWSRIGGLIALSLVALLISPHGIDGALYPLRIFGNYGYTVAENQTLFYLNSLTVNPWIRYVFLLSIVVVPSFFILLYRKLYAEAILLVTFYALSLYQSRHLPFFALAALPTLAITFKEIGRMVPSVRDRVKTYLLISTAGLFFVSAIFMINGGYSQTFDKSATFGTTVHEDYKGATDFVKKHKLPTNIINNFDIGGYLIYQLHPTYPVFVDNRPEAYPSSFFSETYIPALLFEEKFAEIQKKYSIKTAIFSHSDSTDWGKAFITTLYKNPAWRLVYADQSAVIYTTVDKMKDLKQDDNHFKSLIQNEDDHLALLKIAGLLILYEKQVLASQALDRAARLNPDSCMLKRRMHGALYNSPQFYVADNIKSRFWYCF